MVYFFIFSTYIRYIRNMGCLMDIILTGRARHKTKNISIAWDGIGLDVCCILLISNSSSHRCRWFKISNFFFFFGSNHIDLCTSKGYTDLFFIFFVCWKWEKVEEKSWDFEVKRLDFYGVFFLSNLTVIKILKWKKNGIFNQRSVSDWINYRQVPGEYEKTHFHYNNSTN